MYTLQVGVIAMNSEPWKIEENYLRLEAYVREAARRRSKVVIAPEAALDGYVCCTDPDVTREKMFTIAQSIPDGPYLKRAAGLAKELGIYLIFGFLEREGDDLYNACAMFDPQGKIIARYRKVHPDSESFITPGKELKPFDTPIGRVGMLICSDRNTVENFATLGAQGAEIVFLPLNSGGAHENTRILQQRARDFHLSIVVADAGSSVIINSYGHLSLEKYETECVGVGLMYLFQTPRGAEREQFTGRRPDLYKPLATNVEPDRWFDEQGNPTERAERERAAARERLRKFKS